MNKVIRKILSIAVIAGMAASLYATSLWATDTGTDCVMVGINCEFKKATAGIARTRAYDYVKVTADSVCPVGSYKNDYYTTCQTMLYEKGTTTPISDAVQLLEGHPQNVPVKTGHLNVSDFDLYFAGNNPNLSAWIVYSYDGL